MTPVFARSDTLPFESDATQVAYLCDNCARVSIAWAPGKIAHVSDLKTNDKYLIKSDDVKWLPRKGDAVHYEDVPVVIASAASEAHECASIGAKRAAILMARSVIEASAKEHEIVSGNLYAKIDALANRGIIRPLIAEAAHGIRDYGNDMAHGDFGAEVTDEDVEETLGLMGVVLSEVFQVDARTKSLRDRVAKRKASQNGESEHDH